MTRLLRARLWLGAAGVGAVVFVASLTAMLRSCELARMAHASVAVSRDAEIWRTVHASRAR